MIAAVVIGLFLLMVVLAGVVLLITEPAPVAKPTTAFIAAHDLGDDVDVRRVVARYVGRTRDFARRGMVLGILSAVVLGLAWYRQLMVGFGASPIGDILTMGLGGWFLGLLLAARYWRAPPADGPRVAPLTPRDVDRYRSPALGRTMAAVAGLSGALGVAALLPGDSTERVTVAILGLVTVAAITWAARTQGRIARRPQPFVTADLLAADDAMRTTSAQVIGLAAIGVGLVVVGWQASFVARGLADGTGAPWGLLTVPPLVAGLWVAARARRVIHPRVRLVRAPA